MSGTTGTSRPYPQYPQNRFAALFTLPQSPHTNSLACALPQCPQNLAPARVTFPQAAQISARPLSERVSRVSLGLSLANARTP